MSVLKHISEHKFILLFIFMFINLYEFIIYIYIYIEKILLITLSRKNLIEEGFKKNY